jgi:hypothetical protein
MTLWLSQLSVTVYERVEYRFTYEGSNLHALVARGAPASFMARGLSG